jgi:hypothetical protein
MFSCDFELFIETLLSSTCIVCIYSHRFYWVVMINIILSDHFLCCDLVKFNWIHVVFYCIYLVHSVFNTSRMVITGNRPFLFLRHWNSRNVIFSLRRFSDNYSKSFIDIHDLKPLLIPKVSRLNNLYNDALSANKGRRRHLWTEVIHSLINLTNGSQYFDTTRSKCIWTLSQIQ